MVHRNKYNNRNQIIRRRILIQSNEIKKHQANNQRANPHEPVDLPVRVVDVVIGKELSLARFNVKQFSKRKLQNEIYYEYDYKEKQ